MNDVPLALRIVATLVSAAMMAGVLHEPVSVSPIPPTDPCLLQQHRRLWVVDCQAAPPLAFQSERVREVLGAPPCWWSASARRFAQLPGVGERTADALVDLRDTGAWPTPETIDAIEGIGETTAARVASTVDTVCYGEPMRPGFRRTQRVQ
jgi:hypothetical protein